MRKSRAGVGLQMALALFMPPKGKAAAESAPQPDNLPNEDGHSSPSAPPYLTGRWDFSRLFSAAVEPGVVGKAKESAEQVQHLAQDAWRMTVKAAQQADQDQAVATPEKTSETKETAASGFTPKRMTHEEIRLWLQSFNAGPYALLKYEGDVPYEETQNYVPRVLKYYEQDLSSDYDETIEAAAKKYGLDPQMIKAVMKTESDFRNDCVSHAGARGLLQVMPVVWKDIKERYDLTWDYNTQVFEPEKNIEVGCAYLAWLRYDFLPRHFAAYDRNPEAPVVLIRDYDLGVPDRESPRIIAKGDTTTPREDALDLAYVDTDVRHSDEDIAKAKAQPKVVSDAGAGNDTSSKASEKPETKETAKSSKSDSEATKDKSSESKREIADAKSADKKPAKASDSKSEKAERGKIEISDSDSGSKRKTVTSRSSGKAIAISVGKNGKVKTHNRADADKPDNRQEKVSSKHSKDVADATPREDRESQGG